MKLEDSVQFIKGVGPRRAEILAASGFSTVEDLLFHLPFRYEDRRRILEVADTRAGEDAVLIGVIDRVREIPLRRSRGKLLEARLSDGSGSIGLVWFHGAGYFRSKLSAGGRWLVCGRVDVGRSGRLQIAHPEIERLSPEGGEPAEETLARIVPVYQKPTQFTAGAMRTIVHRAVADAASRVRSVVPAEVRSRLGLLPLADALRAVHLPEPTSDYEALSAFRTPAHRTLIFEELFALQVGLSLRHARRRAAAGIAMADGRPAVRRFLERLDFEPTRAQRRVIDEILADMEKSVPMNRLVHGDVGSGKTVVGFAAVLQAVSSGYQAAFMAPTELLAEQHFATMCRWAADNGVRVELLTGSLRPRSMRAARARVAAGEADLVIGTHALIQEETSFPRLGLAIIDEQHRFGVLQRAALRDAVCASARAGGPAADVLMLSATPIPRTLALALYGDVDVSFLDEMPPGRQPVVTRVIAASRRGRLYERMAAAVGEGRQCYVVYPLVEESEKIDLADATTMAQRLQEGPFRDHRVGLIHGRMRPDEKEAVMRRFKEGTIDVLVATTVIEVGIDVPNASIMVIEHAERFGLAQLHQLRGRVGRGGGEAFCCLVADERHTPDALERLRVMERTSDGFEVAEADLRLRGPGEYLGTRQAGIPAFRAANLVRDAELLDLAHREARAWLERDPRLERPESKELKRVIERRWGERLRLAEVG
ncbi:MAG: ATP-dependent DNA helicase RecG [Deltaproteobacteria bacterium]|nr:MAG: ATP-dependent DNA helicase RecG [Deltaproteobacteria bacterium]